MSTPLVCSSLKSVLTFLTQYKNNPDVVRLLQIYNDIYHKEKDKSTKGGQKRHPFIVIEGLNASGKRTLTEQLAEKIEADTCQELKRYVLQQRNAFDSNEELSMAYYVLLNYIIAMQISNTLKERPVVLDRYWLSTIAYGIAKAVKHKPEEYKVPPYGNDVYKWPSDLLKPDIILFISIRESVRIRRYKSKNPDEERIALKEVKAYRKNLVTVYQNILGPMLECVDGNMPKDYVFTEAFEKVKHLFPEY